MLYRAENRKAAPELEVRGTGFEPEEDVPGRSLRSLPGLRLPEFEPTLLPHSVPSGPSLSARGRIRTDGPLRDSVLSAAPLAWLGNPRSYGRLYRLTGISPTGSTKSGNY